MESPKSVTVFHERRPTSPSLVSKSIAIIGGGFYGCVTALRLADAGMKVTLYEQHSELFFGSSGTYGLRLHAGPHYPRSPATRQACRDVLHRFKKQFPSLVLDISTSLYGLGLEDADGLPARVTTKHFEKVCQECDKCTPVDPQDYGVVPPVTGVSGLWNVDEPVLYQGRAKELFATRLECHPNVSLVFNHHVKHLEECPGMNLVSVDGDIFDWAVNCTYFTSFGDRQVLGAQVKFQPCLTLTYDDIDSKRGDEPFMLTIMDGWFPCFMPIVSDNRHEKHNKYMLYHAKYTILGSYDSYEECRDHVNSVTAEWVESEVRPKMEEHFEIFLPCFKRRFKYTGYLLDTATKLKTATEFRRAVVWREGRIIHEFSGKLTENLKASDEVLNIIGNDLPEYESNLCRKSLGELSSVLQETDGACDMGVHRWS